MAQQNLLRRSDGGLRLFETGTALTRVLADLNVLLRFDLVSFDETRGYELTRLGEERLARIEATGTNNAED